MIFSNKIINGMDAEPALMECTASGWGVEHPDDILVPTYLKWTQATAVTDAECSEMIYPYFDAQCHICTRPQDYNSGVCFGDSGGPLACRSSPSAPWKLYGLASFVMSNDCSTDFANAWAKANGNRGRNWIKEACGDCFE
ncbi:unnamed protein product [Cyprideis torosa]|uniref:Uncharacterized protein n=1 Tax=Cyprideis torosa TaxID=163714 RepID=A0A7R8WCV2_9CRUS|nr:unnamed protein product [Cyprideis torosa]CAG0893842.1 unnamed protein product [Cyprideis torosa]